MSDREQEKWIVQILNRSYSRETFDCGNSSLNEYLKKYALQNQKARYSITYVASKEESKEIAGYYCASASVIEFTNIPEKQKKKLPRYPAPVMLIGQLAVAQQMQGKSLGKILLMHGLSNAIKISQEMGIYAVRVDAINEDAKKFYLKYGFVPLEDRNYSLILPLKTIINSRI